ncbi:actin-like protein 7A [Ornithorhynchus anatinus]|uniref:actin-like protein 7A n=1 Tax=Ornithorhynchus anatinus TaxID=9258 RepID=UPI0001554963|nr:actin-like protein 7A [Ornithorhynchus anatinus]
MALPSAWSPQVAKVADGLAKRAVHVRVNESEQEDQGSECSAVIQEGAAKRAVRIRVPGEPREDTLHAPNDEAPKIIKPTRAVVVDLGTGYCKCGFAGEARPSHVVSSTVGKPLPEDTRLGNRRRESFVGHELLNSSEPLKLINPLKHGIIVDWDSMEEIWAYLFWHQLKVPPAEHAVLVSDPPLSPSTNREKYAEMLFETFDTPAMHIAYQSRLSMYSYGKTSGLVVEVGHGVSYVVPIFEGYPLPNITDRLDYAGSDVTLYLMELLKKSGSRLTKDHLENIDVIKKKHCFVALDPAQEMNCYKNEVIDYHLPDGQAIKIGTERFLCAEMLFKPSVIGSKQLGLHTLTLSCLHKCDIALKRNLMSNILLCGGCTMLHGFPARFQKELDKICPNDTPLVISSPGRDSSVWTGGSILASLQAFQPLWVYRWEYQEYGPYFLYRKCF